VGRRALLDVHVDVVGRPGGGDLARQPSPSRAIDATPTSSTPSSAVCSRTRDSAAWAAKP
jgi:hypothetical protein